ncbi:SepM family pheromone-processing serine protease [Effusibacillus consociatus]|uniref:endopeptidase La n=1 Tax=Effusibacillus consociatus TaxID=1117041 RepID=A0ABV9PUW6_9BACL
MATRLTAKRFVTRVVVLLLVILSFFIPLPYYVYRPGSAEELQPILSVEGGQKDEKGALMLTTVLSVPTENIYYYLYGRVMPHSEIVPKEQVNRGMSHEEYSKLLEHMMSTSQENSIVAAMRYLNRPVTINYMGVIVSRVANYSKAKGILQIGDLIERVDNRKISKTEDLLEYLGTKQAGEKVKVELVRDNAKKTEEVELVTLLDPRGNPVPGRAGLGIEPMTKQKVENLLRVNFKTEDIGGPSAGFMFALEIVSQLTPGDLTKGHKIAGTGTINADGNVGQIGGIEHKIVAAHEKGAEIFFSPADVQPDDTNTKVAKARAEEIGTSMKVVPVRTLREAVEYLKNLP